jgi:hypothetical protein
VVALLLIIGGSCAHNVSQDKATGNDGKSKGARELKLENNEARESGIVTYPGGDRVDWKIIEVPEKKKGMLDIKLSWSAPRPGLQLAFDVFDEWNNPIGSSKKVGKKRSKGRIRTEQVEVKGKGISVGEGKYYIRVFAVGRGDAGKYKLVAEFKETLSGPGFDPSKLEIPEPPKVAAIPDAEVPCDPDTFDKNNPACKSVCPTGGLANWPACRGVCPTPPDINNPACHDIMDCPKPPDRRIKKCTPNKFPKCPNIAEPDPENPNCDNAKADPVKARVISAGVSGGDTLITVSAGSSKGVQKTWRGQVLRGDSDAALAGGEVTVIRVDKNVTVGKVKLTTDQINQNPYVKLSPP